MARMPHTRAAAHPRYDALLAEWNELLRRCQSAAPDDAPDPGPYGHELLERWGEPQRKYHTVDHLAEQEHVAAIEGGPQVTESRQ